MNEQTKQALYLPLHSLLFILCRCLGRNVYMMTFILLCGVSYSNIKHSFTSILLYLLYCIIQTFNNKNYLALAWNNKINLTTVLVYTVSTSPGFFMGF